MALCPQCGSQLKPNANYCTVCGTRHLPGAGPLGPPPAQPPGAKQLPAPTPPQNPPAAAVLLSHQGQQTPVKNQMVIGRDPASDLRVDVDDVSRSHAAIVAIASGWAVTDLGSRNGSFVNDQQVLTTTPIFHGDRIRFGASAEFALVDPLHPHSARSQLPATRAITATAIQPAGSAPGGQTTGKAMPVRHVWPKQPDAEGFVVSMKGPFMVERDDKMGKALLAVGLGLINPVLAFIPFAMGKNQIMVTTLRVEDFDSGRPMAVTLLGDVRTIIDDGDMIAVWGKVEQGTVFAVDVHNYTTGATTRIVK